jgi:hypothetical protein
MNSNERMSFQFGTLIAELSPLRGQEAGNAMRAHLSQLSNVAGEECGLCEAEVMQLLNEEQDNVQGQTKIS